MALLCEKGDMAMALRRHVFAANPVNPAELPAGRSTPRDARMLTLLRDVSMAPDSRLYTQPPAGRIIGEFVLNPEL